MTLRQTRQLAVEFERRILTIFPTTALLDKLDTETIYSFLNQYQFLYVHNIYNNLDKIELGSILLKDFDHVLLALLRTATLTESYEADNTVTRCKIYRMPIDYRMYVRSISNVSGTSSSTDIGMVPNVLMPQSAVYKLAETPYNTLRILRNPVAILSKTSNSDVVLNTIYSSESLTSRVSDTVDSSSFGLILQKCLLKKDWVYVDGIKTDVITTDIIFYSGSTAQTVRNAFTVNFAIENELEATDRLNEVIASHTEYYDYYEISMKIPNNRGGFLMFNNIVVNNKDEILTANKPTLTIIHDRYTNVYGVELVYYKEPVYFDIMTSTACELPISCFDELVEGAVLLYSDYVRGGIRRQEEEGRRDRFDRRQQEKEREQNSKEQ